MRISLLVILMSVSFLVVGCGKKVEKTSGIALQAKRIDFPSYLVGTWQSENQNWRITFAKDGSIVNIVNFMGVPFKVQEGGFFEEGLGSTAAMYQLGPIDAYYNSQNSNLNVRILIDYFRMELPQGVLEGSLTDYLVGRISDDHKTWVVNWLNFGDLKGSEKVDPLAVAPEHLIFNKVAEPNS